MDWVFKASSSSWDLSELERDEFDVLVMENDQNIESFSVDSSILEDSDWQKHSTITSHPPPTEPGSGSGSLKKPRNEQNISSCLVDGCRADLSSCREYHRRHRVCEAHSKSPVVAIAGKDQRFCQQCSRFHSVGEFDEVKRSCRKRLDGHNRRRRKPRAGAETIYLNNFQTFFTNHRPTKLIHFGGSQAYRWPVKEKSNQQLDVSVRPPPPSSSSREMKFPFLLGNYSSSSSLVEPQPNNGALSLLSNNTYSDSTPHLPLTNNNSNHLIGMIHFRTQGLELENIFLGS